MKFRKKPKVSLDFLSCNEHAFKIKYKNIKETLEWYANKSNYAFNEKDQVNYVWNDQGHRAQQALEKINKTV